MKICLYFLTCATNKEADKISDSLLDKQLIVCAKKIPVHSKSLWKGKKEEASEILLLMESFKENYEKINKIVKNFSSYETYVLLAIPVGKTTTAVEKWIKTELKV